MEIGANFSLSLLFFSQNHEQIEALWQTEGRKILSSLSLGKTTDTAGKLLQSN